MFKYTYLLSLIFFLNSFYCQSQPPSEVDYNSNTNIDKIYGLNQTLYNGILYNAYYPTNIKGDQFINGKTFKNGEVTIKGVRYTNLELNFDILKQEVILKYVNPENITSSIMISKAWLESFSIENSRFIVLDIPKNTNSIYQVLGNGNTVILYSWKKELKLNAANTNMEFYLHKEQYVYSNNTLRKYHNTTSFLKLFPKENQIDIKEYIKKNRIHVKNASDQKMEELINYCNKLLAK